jgi:putative copper resistance protein D
MGAGPVDVQQAVTALLNLAVATSTGASMSVLWLSRGSSGWAAQRLPGLRRCALAGLLVALLASLSLLWLQAAAMAEVPITEAGPAVRAMLAETHYGVAWCFGTGALAVAATMAAFGRRAGRQLAAMATLGALAVFWYSRSMASHAASEGDASLPLLVDWAHLALISLWIGEVIVAGAVVMAGARPLLSDDRRDRAAYVSGLSSSATAALAGIFATGLFSAWHNMGGIDSLLSDAYGRLLLAKLALVGIAVLLGGFNRFIVMPPWLSLESTGRAPAAWMPRRFQMVLQVEAVVLLAAMLIAAILAATSPPGGAG